MVFKLFILQLVIQMLTSFMNEYLQTAICYVVRVSANLFGQFIFCDSRLIVNYEAKQNIDTISVHSL